MVIPPNKIEQDQDKLAKVIVDNQVSHMLLIPRLYDILLKEQNEEALSSLTCVILAGEAVYPETVKEHFRRNKNCALHNEYGPTEASVWASAYQFNPNKAYDQIPIGKAVAHSKLFLLDQDLYVIKCLTLYLLVKEILGKAGDRAI